MKTVYLIFYNKKNIALLFKMLVNLLLILLCFLNFCVEDCIARKQMENKRSKNLGQYSNNRNIQQNNHTQENINLYSKWSQWSRCIDCKQKRMKKCIHPQCQDSRIYEERPCDKNRCKRKARQQEKFHVVHINKDLSNFTKQGPSKLWTRWSDWSNCAHNCKTFKVRYCRVPGGCSEPHQTQTAYCYHERSECHTYVLNLMDSQKNLYDSYNKYLYNNKPMSNERESKQVQLKCGRPRRKSKMLRIIGGEESKKHKWPWHVAIINKYSEVFCGGTLIAPKWVLTAAHCVRPYLRVRLNEHDLRYKDGREVEVTIFKKFQHPRFNHKTVDNDIALLQLPYEVKLPVACLPRRVPKSQKMCSVMGWGKTDADDMYGFYTLMEARLPIVNKEVCKKAYKDMLITQNMVCAGWKDGRTDTCAGDSGGGLLCPFKSHKKAKLAYSVTGITSFGDGCGRINKYGIYTAVYNYLSWIKDVMELYANY